MNKATLNELVGFLSDMEKELAESNQDVLKKRHFTTQIIRTVLIVMALLTVANSFLLYHLAAGLGGSLDLVDGMAGNFGRMSSNMREITASVSSINDKLVYLETIDSDMGHISQQVSSMTGSVRGVSGSMGRLDRRLEHINQTMGVVDGQMTGITQDIHGITGSVHQISRPANILNTMLPW